MLSRAELKRLRALARRRARAESGLFLAEGVRVVEDALDAGIVLDTALIAPSLEDSPRGAALAERLRAHVRTFAVAERELREVAATETPQGVVVAARIPRVGFEDVEPGGAALVAVLDAVQDPGNFGTVVRSADAFGAAAVFVLPGTVDPWNAKSVRAAAGSSLRVPIVECDVASARAWLRRHRFRVLGADAAGDDVATLPLAPRTALVLGNEGAGLGSETRAMVDGLVAVPIRGAAESLNVGVAAGILLYMLAREH